MRERRRRTKKEMKEVKRKGEARGETEKTEQNVSRSDGC